MGASFRFSTLILGTAFLLASLNVQGEKKALIIAISNYASTTGWPMTHANNDLTLIENTLKKQQFAVQSISNQAATATGIRNKLNDLYENAREGDIIVVHYSGHGQQLQDLNGDEADGMDEAIVPYDAPKNVRFPNYKGEKHILDDEIGVWVGQIKQRLGNTGQLFMLLDCCYSGTGTRAGPVATSRSAEPIVNNNFTPNPIKKESLFLSEVTSATRSTGPKIIPNFVLFTGSGAAQQNYEVKGANGLYYGALSYALAEAFENLSPTETYQTLFRKTSESITRRTVTQSPTSEGDLGALLFGSKFVASSSGFTVITDGIQKVQQTIRIAAGYLNGLAVNTSIGFWNTGTARGEGKPAELKGKITRVELTYSEVELEKPVTTEQLANLQASDYLQLWQGHSLNVFLDNSWEKNLSAKIRESLTNHKLPLVKEPVSADLIIKPTSNYTYLLRPDSYYLLDSIPNTVSDIGDRLASLVQKHAYASFLRGFEVKSPLQAEVVLTNDRQENSTTSQLVKIKAPGKAVLLIKNIGKKPFFVTVQDIQPDATVTTLLPHTAKGYEDIKIAPDQSQEFPITISPPLGLETFKIILTDSPVPLATIPSRSGSKSIEHPLQELLDTSRYRSTSPSLPETSIYTLFFSITDNYEK